MAKAEYLLGYKATVPFEKGIEKTVEWYREAYPQYSKMRKKNATGKALPTPDKQPKVEHETAEEQPEKDLPAHTDQSATQRPLKVQHSEDDEDEVRAAK